MLCLVTHSCPTLCDPIDYGLPGSSRILEWVAIPFSRGSSPPRDQTQVSCIADRFFTETPGKPPVTVTCNSVTAMWGACHPTAERRKGKIPAERLQVCYVWGQYQDSSPGPHLPTPAPSTPPYRTWWCNGHPEPELAQGSRLQTTLPTGAHKEVLLNQIYWQTPEVILQAGEAAGGNFGTKQLQCEEMDNGMLWPQRDFVTELICF